MLYESTLQGLFRADPTTGQRILFFSYPSGLFGLTYDARKDLLYALSSTNGNQLDLLLHINPHSAAVTATALQPVPGARTINAGLAWQASTGLVYTLLEGSGSTFVAAISPDTGHQTQIVSMAKVTWGNGSFGPQTNLAFHPHTAALWVSSTDGDSGVFSTVDLVTGGVTNVAGGMVEAFAFRPIDGTLYATVPSSQSPADSLYLVSGWSFLTNYDVIHQGWTRGLAFAPHVPSWRD